MDKQQYEILSRVEERHWWYLGMRQIVGSLLERYLDPTREHKILDAGCGTGGMMKYLSRYGRVVGIDMADEALSYCRCRDLSNLIRGSIVQLPFASNSFDLLVSFDVLYHRAVIDDRLALREFNRVLAPGGLAVIRVPAFDWLRGSHDAAVHTRHRYARCELSQKLEATGFRLEKVTYVNSFLFPMAAAKRLLEGNRRSLGGDLELPSQPVNRALTEILKLEATLLPLVSFPWGLSVLAIASKDGS